ncbi:hypothetical protein EAX61_15835, partial [Dokdonia sinensis]
ETGATSTIDTNALSNPYDNAVSGLTATNVQDAIDEINASAGTVSLVPGANDGEFIFTDASGATTLISDTSISTIVDNGDGTYTYTDETGATTTIDTNALSNPYDNTVSMLTATNVQDAIDEINASAGTVSLVPGANDGEFIFTDASGATTLISDTSISTLVDNGDGTYTYTDETGATTTIDTNALSNPYDNTVSMLTATNVQDAIDEINASAGTVSLVPGANDGEFIFTDASGATTLISDTSISTLVDNGDGTYTYTDETGATTTIDTNALSNPYDNTVSMLTATNVQDAIDEINASAGTVSLVPGANDGEFIFTDASGATTLISDTSISTLVDNGDGTYTYTDETGATTTIDTNALSNPYDNTVSMLTATNVQDAIDEIAGTTGSNDSTNDAFVNNTTGNRVELGTQSDGTTTRTSGTEFVIEDSGDTGIGTENPDVRLTVADTQGELIRAVDDLGVQLDIESTVDDDILIEQSSNGSGAIILRNDGGENVEYIFTEQGRIQAKAYGENNADVQISNNPFENRQPEVGIASDANGNFIEVPTIFASGKAAAAGGGSIFNATVTRNSLGNYTVTLPVDIGTNYIIQLTVISRNGAGNDNANIWYINQTGTTFDVIVGDNDNGGSDTARFDSEFMFTVIRMPGF